MIPELNLVYYFTSGPLDFDGLIVLCWQIAMLCWEKKIDQVLGKP